MNRWIALLTCAGIFALAPATFAFDSPYEPIAATGDGIVLVEKERTRLEQEFLPLLAANGKEKYLEYYAQLDSKAKNRIARGYVLVKEAGLDARKTAACVAATIESALGIKNARIIIDAWSKDGRDANVETYTTAQKIKSVGKLVPKILALYNIAELEEIDRLQIEVIEQQTAASERRAEASERRAEASRQEIARLQEENAKLDRMLKRLSGLLEQN